MTEELILLYSKYSSSCAPILDFLRRNDISGIRLLCIDNKDVRRRLLTSSSNIKTVPCFLMIRDGRVSSKLEGEEAHIWFSSFTARVMESRAPPLPPPPAPAPAPAVVAAAPKVTPIELPAMELPPPPPAAKAPQRTAVAAPVESMDMDDIMSPSERMTVNRSVPQLMSEHDGQPQEKSKELLFNMSMKHDPHVARENKTMENLLDTKDEMASRKKIRGPLPSDASLSDMPNLSERDFIEHEATAARATGGNKSEEIKAMVEEMRRGREVFDNQMAETDGVPLESMTMRRQ